MGTQYKEVGGGPAIGLAQSLITLLQSGLGGDFTAGGRGGGGGGTGPMARVFQSDPVGRTQGIAGILNDVLSSGAGQVGGALQDILSRENTRNVADIRARFGASGGTSFGTPAAYAEGLYRAEAAPRSAVAIGNLQMDVIKNLLGLATGLAGRGISQRQTVAHPSAFTSALGSLAPAIGAVAPFFAPGMSTAKYLQSLAPDVSGFELPPELANWSPN